MLYNLDWLRQGAEFPPREEVKRLDAYRVNNLIAEDELYVAMPEYKHRLMDLLSNFALDNKTVYMYGANYFQDLVRKTQELTFGDPPVITVGDHDETEIKQALIDKDFIEKMKDAVSDFTALGDVVVRFIKDENGADDFIIVDPSTWYPIVTYEDNKKVVQHVLAWAVPVNKDNWELHVQVHEKGQYTNRIFAVKNYNADSYYVDHTTKQRISVPTYTLGAEVLQGEGVDGFQIGTFPTGIDGFAVCNIANSPKARCVYGISEFDRISEATMEYNVRMTMKNTVLDKHAAPKMSGPKLDGDGMVGNYIEVMQGDPTPSYITWDASMSAVENTIQTLKDDVASLSEMGAVLNNKTFGESQGYDALMIKMTPVTMRINGVKTAMEKIIKKVLAVVGESHGIGTDERDVTITWHSGIPITESVRADIATKHLASGWSKKRVLMTDYGLSEEDADIEIERLSNESPGIPAFGFNEDEE